MKSVQQISLEHYYIMPVDACVQRGHKPREYLGVDGRTHRLAPS